MPNIVCLLLGIKVLDLVFFVFSFGCGYVFYNGFSVYLSNGASCLGFFFFLNVYGTG